MILIGEVIHPPLGRISKLVHLETKDKGHSEQQLYCLRPYNIVPIARKVRSEGLHVDRAMSAFISTHHRLHTSKNNRCNSCKPT
mmetsp:Transcript_45208/g.133638  ORF Transcript_45208/g.133638 Transcript_45208/m.133638 type:complete len:84 (-) Transcript_45208:1231-1482(-)